MRLSMPVLVLAVGTCMALAGCGGGGSSPAAASGASTSGANAAGANASGGSTSGGSTAGGSAAGGSTSGGSASGGSSSTGCTAFATAYKKFLAGYAPPESQTGTEESPLQALSNAITKINASGQLEQDLATLGIDAGLIATGSTEGGQSTPPSAFYSDLQAAGKDCGTTFTRPSASLVREG